MNATTYGPAGESWQDQQADLEGELPRRPRRRFLSPWSLLLCALVTGAIGFFVGVKVEKGQVTSSSSGASALASRFGAALGRSGTRTGSGAASSRGGAGAAGFGGGFTGAGGGDAVGTVASVNGRTIYVTETSGNTVKIKLSSATKITKSETVGRSKIDPGDTVIVGGVTGSKGTITATSLTDSGARSSSATTGSRSSTGSSSSGSVSSLFGG